MKKRKVFTSILCTAVSVAALVTAGGTALADETETEVEVEEVEVEVESEAEVEVEAEEPAETVEEEPSEDVVIEEEVFEEVIEEVIEEEVAAEDICFEVDAVEEDEIFEEVEVFEEAEVMGDDIISEEREVVQDGWRKEGGNWYYYKDGEKVTGWQTIGGKRYYFDLRYKFMFIGLNVIEDRYYIFGRDGAMLTGWVIYENHWYYFTADGAETGWNKHGKNWYYFSTVMDDDGPNMYCCGVFEIEDDLYMFDENGVMRTGWYQPFTMAGNTNWYYAGKDGRLLNSWQKIGGKWYYLNPYMVTGFASLYDEAKGSYSYYYFDENGVMQTGWVDKTDEIYMPGWYYFEPSGRSALGWTKIGGKWYYFRSISGSGCGIMNTGVCGIYDRESAKYIYYCFSSNGVMQTNHWAYSNGSWYYFGNDGIRVTGWQQINGKWYYLRPEMCTGYQWGGDTLYYFGTDGACVNPPENPLG